MSPLAAAFVLLFALLGVTAWLGRCRVQPGWPGSSDRRSSVVLGAAHATSMLAGLVFPLSGLGRLPLPPRVAWGAVGAMLPAFALQLWSMASLGRAYTLTLTPRPAEGIVDRGPYRLVRHPAYLAQILFWLCFAAATRNAITLAAVAVAIGAAYAYRIRTEEAMLEASLGDRYREYVRRTGRLLPRLP